LGEPISGGRGSAYLVADVGAFAGRDGVFLAGREGAALVDVVDAFAAEK
jgi:hypothetical protein